jgi:hypothetical protein
MLMALGLSGCRPTASQAERCPRGAELVPSCGVLLGVTPPHPDVISLRDAEAAAGREFDMVYAFHDINDAIPSSYDKSVVDAGQILHIDIDSRDYGSPDPYTISWRAVADGEYDEQLNAQARGIASLHAPVFVTFDHEPNQPGRAALGSPADFVEAWRHVHDVFETAAATNAVWVWVVMSWPPALATALRMWPGNDYVDWISWDAYNSSGCRSGAIDPGKYRTFADAALPFLTWIKANGPAAGIDVHKPMMISETGTVGLPSEPAAQTDWFRGMATTLGAHPRIKAVTLWDHLGSSPGCDFRFVDRSGSLATLPWSSTASP